MKLVLGEKVAEDDGACRLHVHMYMYIVARLPQTSKLCKAGYHDIVAACHCGGDLR